MANFQKKLLLHTWQVTHDTPRELSKKVADFIETVILASKDVALLCFHDVTLDDTTDVADHKEFSHRRRTYEVQGINVTGWFVGMFSIITFEDFIAIALDASSVVGIYPEIKNPIFINQHVKWLNGKKFEDIFVETLLKYGYKGSYMSKDWLKQPVFIQSFAPTSLVYISNLTDSPKVFLIDDVTILTQDTNQSYSEITSNSYLEYIKEYVVSIGPSKDTVVHTQNNFLTVPSDLLARAHAHDLQVHPYTFRNEDEFLHLDFHQDPYAEHDYWINTVGVDGVFTDFTGNVHNHQVWAAAKNEKTRPSLLHKISSLISSHV